MYKIQPIIDYIIDTYEFKIAPCSIPRSDFQYYSAFHAILKRYFYLFILNKVSEKLFFFLRDKISPIKYREERPDGSIWLNKRDDNGLIFYEIEIRPVPAETTEVTIVLSFFTILCIIYKSYFFIYFFNALYYIIFLIFFQ